MAASVRDVVVAGAGPLGLLVATLLARGGRDVLVLERRPLPRDKACGEGLMPRGVERLSRLGVLDVISAADRAPFRGIRFVQEDGAHVTACFPGGGTGWGIQRAALSQALWLEARAAGVEVRAGEGVTGFDQDGSTVRVRTSSTEVETRFFIGADGLHSFVRRHAGLQVPEKSGALRRSGARRHFEIAPWSEFVEVHLAEGAEAYVTPCGTGHVGVALLWEAQLPKGLGYDGLLREKFPALWSQVAGREAGEVLGSGPFHQRARRLVDGRLALLGDAGGYEDALTGEGLAMGFAAAEELASAVLQALDMHTGAVQRGALLNWESRQRRRFRRYEMTARGLLALVRRPALRRRVMGVMGSRGDAASALLGWTMG